jgi:aryl-alcohol dehydrogenase-like predicted oxidoreductase
MSDRRRLGKTTISVSTIAMGCWAIVGDSTWGDQSEKDAVEAIRTALDMGINFLDTAEGYGGGYSEQLIAKALADLPDADVVIGSKVSPNHTNTFADLEAACEQSLRNLKRDVIDVYHLHWPNRKRPIGDIVGDFQKLVDAGKIRCFAVSNFGKADLGDLLAAGRAEVNQLPYNLLWRAIEHEIQPICVEHDISITCYSPIAQGLLTGKFASPEEVPDGRARTRHFSRDREQVRHDEEGAEEATFAAIGRIAEIARELGAPMGQVALAWLIRQPGVASVLVGARNAEQIKQNAQAMHLHISDDVNDRLCRATDGLKEHFGTNPDMWQSTSRYR